MFKIGIVVCLHGNLLNARRFASRFRRDNVDAIVLDGDMGTSTEKDQERSLRKILDIFVNTRKPVFMMPGSHEKFKEYTKVLRSYKNTVINCNTTKKVSFIDGWSFVFLPGSDVMPPGAGFKLLKDKKKLKMWNQYIEEATDYYDSKKIVTSFVSELSRFSYKKTILFCHVPPKNTVPHGIDVAHFGEPTHNFITIDDDEYVNSIEKESHVFPLQEAKLLKSQGFPISIHKKNVGNVALQKMLKRLNINFFVCGHIHESGGRAVDKSERKLFPNRWYTELFYNAAAGCDGRVGIVTVKDNKVKYQNITLH